MERKSARLYNYSVYKRYTKRRLRDFYFKYLRRIFIRYAKYNIIIVYTNYYRQCILLFIKTYIFCQRVVSDTTSLSGSGYIYVGMSRCERVDTLKFLIYEATVALFT